MSDNAAPGRRVTITLTLDEAAAIALATIIHGVAPEDHSAESTAPNAIDDP